LGLILLILTFGLTVVSASLFWSHWADADGNGYQSSEVIHIHKDSYAIIIERDDIHRKSAWIWDWGNLISFKIEAINHDPSRPIFIGVAPQADVEVYIDDVEYNQITDFRIRPYKIEFVDIHGNSEPLAPRSFPNTHTATDEEFWAGSVYGTGSQILKIELEAEDYTFIIMNDDGAAGIDMDIKVGAKAPLILGTAVAFMVAAIMATTLTVAMFVYARRGL